MPNSYPSNARQLATWGGIPLLALVLTTGTPAAKAADRTPSPAPTHSTRDLGHPAATGLETCPGSGAAAKPAGAQAHDGAPAPPSSGTPAASHSQASPRDKAAEHGGGSRLLRRSGDGRVAPRAPIEEPRRGGVGTLIGITFA
jgi:hypothetical protein